MRRTKVTFDGHELTKFFSVRWGVERPLPEWTPNLVTVPGRAGAILAGTRAEPTTVSMELAYIDKSRTRRQEAARTLASWLAVDEELAGGVTVFDVVVRNSDYAIVPVTSMASELAQSVGFSRRRLMSIRLAVEEMLTERITDAYSAAGDIRVRITLMPEWLRISFSDDGAEYFIDKRRDTSMSAKIILKAVSDFHTDYPGGKPVYCMDFLYENEFSIQEFLMKSKEEIEA